MFDAQDIVRLYFMKGPIQTIALFQNLFMERKINGAKAFLYKMSPSLQRDEH
jgi:hypothetical protein